MLNWMYSVFCFDHFDNTKHFVSGSRFSRLWFNKPHGRPWKPGMRPSKRGAENSQIHSGRTNAIAKHTAKKAVHVCLKGCKDV